MHGSAYILMALLIKLEIRQKRNKRLKVKARAPHLSLLHVDHETSDKAPGGSSIFSVFSDSGMQAWFHLHVYTSMTRNRAGKEARARLCLVCTIYVWCVCVRARASIQHAQRASWSFVSTHTYTTLKPLRGWGCLGCIQSHIPHTAC